MLTLDFQPGKMSVESRSFASTEQQVVGQVNAMHTQRQEPCQTNIDTHDKDSLTLLQEQLFAYSGMETYSKSKAMRDALFNSVPIVTPWWVLSI